MENRPQQPGRPGKPEARPPSPAMRSVLIWVSILVFMLLMFQVVNARRKGSTEIPFRPAFKDLVEGTNIVKCTLVHEISGTQYIEGQRKAMAGEDPTGEYLFKVNVHIGDHLLEYLDANQVAYEHKHQNPYLMQLLSSIVPVILIFGLLYFLFMRQVRSAGHGAMSFGKSRARLLSRDKNKITFKNVAGIDEAKEEVQEIIEFLKDPGKFGTLGGRIPKGVLLMGPPGTGKTLLAKAIAGEADVPFFSISGSDFVEMFVGVGASRVRDMFEQGKRSAPCLIFIDEIDAVGRSRFSGIGGGHDEREQTLNALLVQMDGFETQDGVIILAATNRPDVLDQALVRPGRFDRQIVIDLPDIKGREAILKMHARTIKLAADVEMKRLARGTPGFPGADLENLLNEAALLAAREGKAAVDQEDLEEARDKVRWGRERRSRVLDDKERRITAYHEAGHAIVMASVEESEPLHKLTIIPRGVAYLGATMQLPEKDRYMEGRIKLTGMLAGLMGGRVAEEMTFGDITSGASSDLHEATRVARLMVCSWGMSEEMGPQTFGDSKDLMFLGREITRTQDYSDDTANAIDRAVNELLRSSYDQAREILKDQQDMLVKIAEMLLDQETVDGRDVEDLIHHGRIRTVEERETEQKAKDAKEEAEEAARELRVAPDTDDDDAVDEIEKKQE